MTGGSYRHKINASELHFAGSFQGYPNLTIFGQWYWYWYGTKCRYLAKNTNFGRLWAKNPNFWGLSKSVGTHITEKPPGQLVRTVCWSGIGSNGPKNDDIWPKMSVLGQIWPFLG